MAALEQPPTGQTQDDASAFQIGVNYWPLRKATRLWRDFDPGELHEDLDRLTEWKISPIRIFLRWEDFQPDRDRAHIKALHRLVKLADWSADRGLSLWICLFVGHVHRANWLPYWMVSHEPQRGEPLTLVNGFQVPAKPRWPLSDPSLMQAQQRLLEEVLSALRNHPALWAYDLGERLSSLYQSIPIDLWRRWLHKMIEEIRRWDSSTPVTLGLQPADLLEPGGLEPRMAAEVCDYLSMACLTLEASYGMVGQEWQPKRVLSGLQAVDRKCIPKRPDTYWMDVEPEQYWRAPRAHIQRLYERFRDQIPLSRY